MNTMDTANQSSMNSAARFPQAAALVWYTLRSFRVLTLLLIWLLVIWLLSLLIPQQFEQLSGLAAETAWLARLPGWLQPIGSLLFDLGLAHIRQSIWFWLPVGLLLLHSALALADYARPSWQRARLSLPPLEWQHPLTRRIEQSIRLSDAPDEFLAERQQVLAGQGFVIHETADDERLVGATHRRWSWLGIVIFYSGILVMILAFLISYFWLERDRLELSSLETTASGLLAGRLMLDSVEEGRLNLTYTPLAADADARSLTWRRYWPALLNGALIFPTDLQPLLTIEVRDATGQPLQLAAPQAEVSAAEQLSLPLDRSASPIYFSIADPPLAFQIAAGPTAERYEVQVLRGEAGEQVEDLQVSVAETTKVQNLFLSLSRSYELQAIAGRDPALPLYVLALFIIGGGGVLAFLLPPAQVWLIPDVKGRGGQLYGVMERQFGVEEKMEPLLQRVLGKEADTEMS